ncbi:hypothetical protein [Streptomyces canus]|uniref:hypothetical protein n=1 Tax=Streptomyces canus TaxID=58343 RepID=UPI0033A27874
MASDAHLKERGELLKVRRGRVEPAHGRSARHRWFPRVVGLRQEKAPCPPGDRGRDAAALLIRG